MISSGRGQDRPATGPAEPGLVFVGFVVPARARARVSYQREGEGFELRGHGYPTQTGEVERKKMISVGLVDGKMVDTELSVVACQLLWRAMLKCRPNKVAGDLVGYGRGYGKLSILAVQADGSSVWIHGPSDDCCVLRLTNKPARHLPECTYTIVQLQIFSLKQSTDSE